MKARSLLAALLLLAACDRRPQDKLTNPVPAGAVPAASADWVLYDDELRTGGGYLLIPEADNQTLVDGDRSASAVGRKSLYYSWNGGPVSGQHAFAGFGLLVAETTAVDASTPARDLSSSGFTKISFWLKGSLGENVILRVEGPVDGTGATLAPRLDIPRSQISSSWTRFTLSVPASQAVAAFSRVKQYVNFIFVYAQPSGTTAAGEGGVIHLDQVTYER
jgi:hypothetical protein